MKAMNNLPIGTTTKLQINVVVSDSVERCLPGASFLTRITPNKFSFAPPLIPHCNYTCLIVPVELFVPETAAPAESSTFPLYPEYRDSSLNNFCLSKISTIRCVCVCVCVCVCSAMRCTACLF